MFVPTDTTSKPLGVLGLAVTLSGTFLFVLDFFIVNVALPSIQADLRASPSSLQWIVAGYGTANAALLIFGGRLGDMLGQRRVFAWGVVTFTFASLLCGVAPSPELLVVARMLQGAAGALMQPQVLAILNLMYQAENRARAFACYGLALGGAAVLGQVIGGVLIDLNPFGLGWRTCFLINIPVGVFVMFLIPRALPDFQGQLKTRLDALSIALIGIAMTALSVGLIEGRANHWPLWTLMLIAIVAPMLAWFVQRQSWLESNGRIPLLTSSLFRQKKFMVGIGAALAFYMSNAAFYFVLALYLQNGLHLSPLASGMMFALMASGFFAATLNAHKLQVWLKGKSILIGAVILSAAHLCQALIVSGLAFQSTTVWALGSVLVAQGIGIGMVMAPLASKILLHVAVGEVGAASGLLATINQLGNAVGVAAVGMVFFAISGDIATPATISHAFSWSLVYLFVMTAIAAKLMVASERFDLPSAHVNH
jgi:EmrB/QacA subfamily drug resistance transporter